MRFGWVVVPAFALLACGGTTDPDAGPRQDAGSDAGTIERCERAADCRTSEPCTMAVCAPDDPGADARGCVVAGVCAAGEVCESDRCVPTCADPDADDDGDPSEDCGGNDCDDDDPLRRSTGQEQCDADGLDEDCRSDTIANTMPGFEDGDADGDGLIDYRCFNTREDGTENHGPDCDQSVAGDGLRTLAHCSACGERCTFFCNADGCDPAVEVGAGGVHTCATLESGRVMCWGSNARGQLGTGDTSSSMIPVAVSGGVSAQRIGVGRNGNLALESSGTVWFWGEDVTRPLSVVSIVPTMPTTIAGGDRIHCATYADGRIYCNENGGYAGYILGVEAAVDVAVGAQHRCALLRDATVSCWGSGVTAWQLGSGGTSTDQEGPPLVVDGVESALELCAGANHSCARLASGSVACWGSNQHGQLGDGGTHMVCFAGIDCSATPVLVAGVSDAVAISCGLRHSCAVRADGTVACWGENAAGQLGDGTTINRDTPVTVTGLGAVTALARGSSLAVHSCAIADGRVLCWGLNLDGQLGDGTATNRMTPVAVASP